MAYSLPISNLVAQGSWDSWDARDQREASPATMARQEAESQVLEDVQNNEPDTHCGPTEAPAEDTPTPADDDVQGIPYNPVETHSPAIRPTMSYHRRVNINTIWGRLRRVSVQTFRPVKPSTLRPYMSFRQRFENRRSRSHVTVVEAEENQASEAAAAPDSLQRPQNAEVLHGTVYGDPLFSTTEHTASPTSHPGALQGVVSDHVPATLIASQPDRTQPPPACQDSGLAKPAQPSTPQAREHGPPSTPKRNRTVPESVPRRHEPLDSPEIIGQAIDDPSDWLDDTGPRNQSQPGRRLPPPPQESVQETLQALNRFIDTVDHIDHSGRGNDEAVYARIRLLDLQIRFEDAERSLQTSDYIVNAQGRELWDLRNQLAAKDREVKDRDEQLSYLRTNRMFAFNDVSAEINQALGRPAPLDRTPYPMALDETIAIGHGLADEVETYRRRHDQDRRAINAAREAEHGYIDQLERLNTAALRREQELARARGETAGAQQSESRALRARTGAMALLNRENTKHQAIAARLAEEIERLRAEIARLREE